MSGYATRARDMGITQRGAQEEAHGGWAARAPWKRGQLEQRLEGNLTAGWDTELGRPLGIMQRILPGEAQAKMLLGQEGTETFRSLGSDWQKWPLTGKSQTKRRRQI